MLITVYNLYLNIHYTKESSLTRSIYWVFLLFKKIGPASKSATAPAINMPKDSSNPADKIKQRQLLWGFKKSGTDETSPAAAAKKLPPAPQQSFNKWEATNLGDNSANEKFRRLMGIKSAAPASAAQAGPSAALPVESQAKMFDELEQGFERAREITHTQRGLGLGFSSTMTAKELKKSRYTKAPVQTKSTINFVKK